MVRIGSQVNAIKTIIKIEEALETIVVHLGTPLVKDHLNGIGELETGIPRRDMMIDLAKILDGIHLQGQINAMVVE